MNSEGCTLTTASESQRREPLTDLPTPGMNTSASSTMPATKSHGARRCHAFIGIWKATNAAKAPTATNIACRARKYQERKPVCAEDSAIAIDDEYTITSPIASRMIAHQVSDAS